MDLQTDDGKAIPKFTVISIGHMLRTEIEKGTPLGIKIKSILEKGILASNEDVLTALQSRLNQEDVKGKGVIFDGFPRTLSQAESIKDLKIHGKEVKIDAAVLLELPKELLIERLSFRLTCKACGAVYNSKIKKPKVEGRCDNCGGILYQRDDDTPAAIGARLKDFEDKTKPLVKYFEGKKLLRTVRIDNHSATPRENAMKIVAALGLKVVGH